MTLRIVNTRTAELRKANTPENYKGSVLNVSEIFGAAKLGFHIEVIDPKNFSAPYHYHDSDEELFFVVEGEAIVRYDGTFHKVTTGDLFFYPTGAEHAHNIYNHTDKPFRFLGLSNVSERDICYYPDSKKHLSEDGPVQNGHIVDYYKDEEDPAKYWPAFALKGDV